MNACRSLVVALAIGARVAAPASAEPPAPSAAPAPADVADSGPAAAATFGRMSHSSVELGAPPSKVFRSFATAEELKKAWSVAQARVDFRVGGQIRTRYDKDGDLDAPTAIVNTILAYEPDRMLAIKPTAPEGSPAWLKKICETGWNVLRLEPIGPDGRRTRLTLTGMGYGEGPEYDTALAFFEKGNQWTLDRMKKLFPMETDEPDTSPVEGTAGATGNARGKVIELDRFVASGAVPVELHKEAVVAAPPSEVFKLWTSAEGFKAFLGVGGVVDLRIGGPLELHFGPDLPAGQRGSEGCQFLSYLPDRMVSYSWSAPPTLPAEREKRTWVVVLFHPVEGGKTRVELNHLGFGPHGEGRWDDVRSYFDRAWGNVLKALEAHVAKAGGGGGAGTEGK